MTNEELESLEYAAEQTRESHAPHIVFEEFEQKATPEVILELVAEIKRLRSIESIVRGMVGPDLTVQHPGSNTVKRLVELLGEIDK